MNEVEGRDILCSSYRRWQQPAAAAKSSIGNSGQDINLMEEEEEEEEEEIRMAWIMSKLHQMKKKLESSCK